MTYILAILARECFLKYFAGNLRVHSSGKVDHHTQFFMLFRMVYFLLGEQEMKNFDLVDVMQFF